MRTVVKTLSLAAIILVALPFLNACGRMGVLSYGDAGADKLVSHTYVYIGGEGPTSTDRCYYTPPDLPPVPPLPEITPNMTQEEIEVLAGKHLAELREHVQEIHDMMSEHWQDYVQRCRQ